MIFPLRVLIGSLALIASLPYVIAAMFCDMAGDSRKADWLLGNCPLVKWHGYVNRKGYNQ